MPTIRAYTSLMLLDAIDKAIAAMRSVPTQERLRTQIPEAIGGLTVMRDELLRVVVVDAEAEPIKSEDAA